MSLRLYSSYGCPRCSLMKKILEKLDVDYEELDIDENSEYRDELEEKIDNSDRIPVLEKDGEIVHIGSCGKEEIAEKLDES